VRRLELGLIIGRSPFSIEAVGKRPSAALPSSLVTAAHLYVRFIPRDFVPQQSLRDGHFPSASEEAGFSTVSLAGVEKHSSPRGDRISGTQAAMPSSLVIPTYFLVRLTPRDFGRSRPAPQAGSSTSGIYDKAGFRKAQLASERF
jgi:hypothetical protein